MLQEIAITDIKNIRIGHAQNREAATGCSVIICEKGAVAGCDIRGGGPATREIELLNPIRSNQGIHALIFSGGSAYGLDAASGVMKYLEEHNIGLPVGCGIVPIVSAACIFDLIIGDSSVRPDKDMGYQACVDAEHSNCSNGNIGAGVGATVGKIKGPGQAMKSGLGCCAMQLGDLQIGGLAVVNSLGDIVDQENGRKLAGLRNEQGTKLLDSTAVLIREETSCELAYRFTSPTVENTTLAAVITNGKFDKTQINKIASMAASGLSRTIKPVFTSWDGDTIFAMATGEVETDPETGADVAGILAAEVLGEAIKRAVLQTSGSHGFPAACDLHINK